VGLHMAGNRLLVFARKPAPVQVTLAYPGTSGLPTIDYRLTDPHLDPPGQFDDQYSETSIRLRDSFWCYEPQPDDPEVNPLPVLANGYVTFGCLNNFCKISPLTLEMWAPVLSTIPNSRLLLLAAEGSHRQRMRDWFERAGISGDRISFASGRPHADYLRLYHNIDIGLDTLPYNGHTTSLDSFWMGVPVVTLAGQTVVGRAGVSQLRNLNLPHLIAETREQFVEIAVNLSADLEALNTLRNSLRDRMRHSVLTAAPRFARSIEAALREIWTK